MLYRLGRGAARHKWWVAGAWLVLIVALVAGAVSIGGKPRNSFTIPGAESQEALDLLEADFPDASGPNAQVVFHATDGAKVTDSANSTAIAQVVASLAKLDDVGTATDPTTAPYSEVDVSKDETISYSTVTYSVSLVDLPKDAFEQIDAATKPAKDAGLDVQFGGTVVDLEDPLDPGISAYSDEIGLAVALLILIISFGAVVAAGLPIAVALVALATSSFLIVILEHFFQIGSLNPIFGAMIGLGVGIDYSLLVVNRYLQDRDQGLDTLDATGRAISTAGRAVLFAGAMICYAVLALAVMGIPYVTVLGFTSAMYVALTVVAAITFLPALLGMLGHHIEALTLPWVRKRRARDDADRPTFFGRWARRDQKLPWLYGGLALIALIALAVPMASASLGFDNDGNDPESSTERQSYDLLSEGFGEGVNGPLLVAMKLPGSSSSDIDTAETDAADLTKAINGTTDVDSALGPVSNSDKTAAIIEVTPDSGPSSDRTSALVRDLRDNVIPKTLEGKTLSADVVYVGGATAENIDFTERIEERLALFIAVVLGGAFLLLLVVLRSIIVPIKAVILNLLMFGVGMGVIVAVFQWGWGRSLLGVEGDAPIESVIPLVLFAVVFGLSTDYEVFLMTRIREEYDEIGDAREAVISGLAKTGRVVASAAFIMASVFFSFVTNPTLAVKMLGLGLGTAILLDGLLVRLVIVPSFMQLTGEAAWWFPKWLNRLLPKVAIDDPSPDVGD